MEVIYGGYTIPTLDKDSFSYNVDRDSWSFSINFVAQSNGGVGALIAILTPMYAALKKDNQKLEVKIRGSSMIVKEPATRTGFEIRTSVDKVGKAYGSVAQEYIFKCSGKEPASNADGSYPISHSFTYDNSELISAQFTGTYHSSGGSSALTLINNAVNGAEAKCEALLTSYFGATVFFDKILKKFDDSESLDNSIQFSLTYSERPFEDETIGGATDDYNIDSFTYDKDITQPSAISGAQPTTYVYNILVSVSRRHKTITDFNDLYINTIRPYVRSLLGTIDSKVLENPKKITDTPNFDLRRHKISVSGVFLIPGKNNYLTNTRQITFSHTTNIEFLPLGDGKKYSDYMFPPVEQLHLTINIAFMKMGEPVEINMIDIANGIKPPPWLGITSGRWIYLSSTPTYEKNYEATNDGEIDTQAFSGSSTFRWSGYAAVAT